MSDSFDYIIVGAGTAGCVLANRLSRNPQHRVLLIEGGHSDKTFMVDMPAGVGLLMAPGGKYVDTYKASKGEGLGDDIPWLKGKVIGGSSSVNGMIYSHGQPEDFDGWEAAGCTGWGWDKIGACFAAMENHEMGADEFRGTGGPLDITIKAPRDKSSKGLCEALLNAAEVAGTPRVADINNAPKGGFGYQPHNIAEGRRQGAGRAFLHPVMKRKNLEVRTKTKVVKVLFDGKKAIGVLVRDETGEHEIRARGEIILSAGAIESPKLLQLSGIGDAKLLQRLNIPVIANVPEVGRNLKEHLYLQVRYRVTEGSKNSKFASRFKQYLSGLQYLLFKSGRMADRLHELGGLVKAHPKANRPDAHLLVGLYSMTFTADGFAFDSKPGITFGVVQMRPESCGETMIVSADPDTPPAINANFLASSTDRDHVVSILRYVRKLVAQDPLKPYICEEISPGPTVESDEDIIRCFREQGGCGFHVASTCRMGSDGNSVVDPKLRVRGVEGLRVMDTSIFPTLHCYPNGPVMACALRASQIILGEEGPISW